MRGDGDGARCALEQALAGAPGADSAEAARVRGADHDQVGRFRLGQLVQALGGGGSGEHRGPDAPRLDPRVEQPGHAPYGGVAFDVVVRDGGDDHVAGEGEGELAGECDRILRAGGGVDADQDSAHALERRVRAAAGKPWSAAVSIRGFPRLQLDELVLERVPHELRARRAAQLLLDVRAVGLDRARREEELLRDLAVGVAQRDQAEHLHLALAQVVGRAGGSSGAVASRAPSRGFRYVSPLAARRIASSSSSSAASLSTNPSAPACSA